MYRSRRKDARKKRPSRGSSTEGDDHELLLPDLQPDFRGRREQDGRIGRPLPVHLHSALRDEPPGGGFRGEAPRGAGYHRGEIRRSAVRGELESLINNEVLN